MTDSYFADEHDRDYDHEPDIEDWNTRGIFQDTCLPEGIDTIKEPPDEDYEYPVDDNDVLEEGIKKLNDLKEELLSLLRQVKEDEDSLIDYYEKVSWAEIEDDMENYDYYEMTQEEKVLFDIERNYGYKPIAWWINQHPTIKFEMEIEEKRRENLEQHRRKMKDQMPPDIDEIPF